MALIGITLSALILVLILVWFRRNLVMVTIEGVSMEPTVTHGDRVLVRRRRLRRVRRGDIVVLGPPLDGPYRTAAEPGPDGRIWNVKRVAALPGDPVPPDVPGGGQVGAGSLVVLGDNRAASIDSRQRGPFSADRLMGVVVCRLSPR